MLSTATWQEIDLHVLNEVHLDNQNVRLENVDANSVEADILNDLFANEGVFALVQGISQIGFLTHEMPVVVRRNRRYVVVEGNRRVAALKAIHNPMLVPAFQARIREATKPVGKPVLKAMETVRVKVAPSQDQANELIAALHTSNQRKAWSPARQAAFFQAQITAGRTYADLKRRYPTADVEKFMLRSYVLSQLETTKYDDAELLDFVTSAAWKRARAASTVDRIRESKEFFELSGLHIDGHGVIKTKLTKKQWKAVSTVIAEGIKAGDLNTRSINKVTHARFVQLIRDLRRSTGTEDPTPDPASPSSTPAGKAPPVKPAKPLAPPRPASRAQLRNRLQVSIPVPATFSLALQRHFGELSVLDVQRLPNTAYLVLRAILEKSIKQYAELKNENIAASAGTSQGNYVQLHHALKWFEDYIKVNGPKGLVQPIQKIRTNDKIKWGNFSTSKAAMDAANHNHLFHVDPSDVLALWDAIDPLLRELLAP